MGYVLSLNGDYSGITDEDKLMADEWWERNNVVSLSPLPMMKEAVTVFYPLSGFRSCSDVMDCTVMVMLKI